MAIFPISLAKTVNKKIHFSSGVQESDRIFGCLADVKENALTQDYTSVSALAVFYDASKTTWKLGTEDI